MSTPGLIFIVGNSRSGTTMLGRVFGNHSLVHTFGELHFFEHQLDTVAMRSRGDWVLPRLVAMLERLITSARAGFFSKVSPGRYAVEAETIIRASNSAGPVTVYRTFLEYETKAHGKRIPCEQTPRYLFFADEILMAFPDAKIINMVRDPRDVLLSQKNKWRRRFLGAKNIPLTEALRAWVNYHPYTISMLWSGALRKGLEMEPHPRFKTVRFEDLLGTPEKTVQELCDFLGLGYEPGMVAVPQVGSSSGHDSPARKGIDGGRVGGWRKGGLTPVELYTCERIASEQMRRMGYVPESARVGLPSRVFNSLTFIIKAAMALTMNLKRTRNLRETLRRRMGTTSGS
jgi:hypothetical protein